MKFHNASKKTKIGGTAGNIEPGRHSATITQVVCVGYHRYQDGDPKLMVAFTFQVPNGPAITKGINWTNHSAGTLSSVAWACDINLDGGEVELSDFLGKHVIVEVEGDRWPKVTDITPLEDFDDTPEAVDEDQLLCLEDVGQATKEQVKAMAPDARRLFGKRDRRAEQEAGE
jgi:hypothetical protein